MINHFDNYQLLAHIAKGKFNFLKLLISEVFASIKCFKYLHKIKFVCVHFEI